MAHDENWSEAHRLLKASPTWNNLALDGIQHAGEGSLFEQRRCPDCGSTISNPVSAERACLLLSRLAEVLSVSIEQIAQAISPRPPNKAQLQIVPEPRSVRRRRAA